MGGVVTETFMKLHKEWNDYIDTFVAVCVPFDGSSGWVVSAPLYGYNL